MFDTGLVLEFSRNCLTCHMVRTPFTFPLKLNNKMATHKFSDIEALALLDRDEADDVSSLSELSSSEEEDIDENLFGLADDFIRSEDLDIALAILDGIGEDNNQDQCHLPTSR